MGGGGVSLDWMLCRYQIQAANEKNTIYIDD